MGRALYRKHRPKSLSEVIGQEHITDTLGRALKQGLISHAYLFTGPRGVGKTSIARIMAYEVNNFPYDEEGTHLDIIEIDAASNRRIDEIRELKERINIAPTSAKYKVYIIDEVHMLTKEAFNALLKTLEEPPDHAIFILATTEAHKVPETIKSRTQRFTLKPVTIEKVTTHLKQIAKSENIAIDEAALNLISAHGEGSFRDSISLLDQIRHNGREITLTDVQQAIGQAPDELLNNLLSAVDSKNIHEAATCLTALRMHGVQPSQVAIQMSQKLRQSIVTESMILTLEQTLKLLNDLLGVPASKDPSLTLELAIYGSALSGNAPERAETETKSAKIINSSVKPKNPQPKPYEETPAAKPEQKPKHDLRETADEQTSVTPPKVDDSSKSTIKQLDSETWQEVLTTIKPKHNTLYGISRMAIPKFEANKLILSFSFPFHQKKLNDSKNKQLLVGFIKQVTGTIIDIECVVDEKPKDMPVTARIPPKTTNEFNLETISNIFGGAEIVE